MSKRTERLARMERQRKRRLRRWPKHQKGRIKGLRHLSQHDRTASEAVKKRQRGEIIRAVAPAIFDLEQSTEDMLAFFNTVRDAIRNGTPVNIEMANVTSISVSALLYLVAIMQDAKYRGDIMDVHGNMPNHKGSHDIMEASGFFNYVKRRKKKPLFVRSSSIMQITSGMEHKSQLVSDLCAFIRESLNMNKKDTRYIFKIITELMQNTIDHAYPNHTGKDRMWYMSAQFLDEEVEIAFLDTGLGIPKTVKKKMGEKIGGYIGLTEDEDYMMSALDGTEIRTSTGKRYRGKGLPKIYQLYKEGKVSKLAIMSGKGYINGLIKNGLKKKIFGTLFRFRIGVKNG